MSVPDLGSGSSPFGPAAAKAKAGGPTPFVSGAGPEVPGTAASPAAGPAPPGHTPEPSPRQMAEAIETLAARIGELPASFSAKTKRRKLSRIASTNWKLSSVPQKSRHWKSWARSPTRLSTPRESACLSSSPRTRRSSTPGKRRSETMFRRRCQEPENFPNGPAIMHSSRCAPKRSKRTSA